MNVIAKFHETMLLRINNRQIEFEFYLDLVHFNSFIKTPILRSGFKNGKPKYRGSRDICLSCTISLFINERAFKCGNISTPFNAAMFVSKNFYDRFYLCVVLYFLSNRVVYLVKLIGAELLFWHCISKKCTTRNQPESSDCFMYILSIIIAIVTFV